MTSNEYKDDIKFKKKCSFKNIKKEYEVWLSMPCMLLSFILYIIQSELLAYRQTGFFYFTPILCHLSRDEFHKLISFILFNTISLDLYTFLPS